MTREQHIEDFFEDKARAGDGQFAIAYALMQLKGEQKNVAYALQRLGFGDAATPMGAAEHLAMVFSEMGGGIAQGLESIATSIEEAK